jgi:hypothetical protein
VYTIGVNIPHILCWDILGNVDGHVLCAACNTTKVRKYFCCSSECEKEFSNAASDNVRLSPSLWAAVRWRHERVTETDILFRLTHLPYNSFRKLRFFSWSGCDNSDSDISIELVDLQARQYCGCMCFNASRIKTSFTKLDAELNKIKCVNLYIGMINTA